MIKKLYEKNLKQEELKQILKDITAIKARDILDKTKEVIILDSLIQILLLKRHKDKVFIEKNISSFFKAADIDQNGFISFREFITFMRSIDP